MSDIQFDYTIERPISWWCQQLSFDSKEFFTALGKTVVNAAVQDGKGAMENALDILKATGLEGQTPAMLTWRLINTALHKSIYNLLCNSADLFPDDPISDARVEELSEILTHTMENTKVGINADFFSQPKNLGLLDAIEVPITDWLLGLGLSKYEATSIYIRLKDSFAVSLHAEWLAEPDTYGPIQDAVNSPFLKATRIEREWVMYKAWLQEQANQAVFSEAFGLRQVYVPLRGYYETKVDREESSEVMPKSWSPKAHRRVVQVDEEIKNWVENFNADDAVKVISGGPGSGKSSAAKVLAADISMAFPHVSVLFVPLHHFDIEDDLVSAVENFVNGDLYLSQNPLDIKHGSNRLLIIFDGLDELSMRGKAASEAALSFVDEVITKIGRFNAKTGIERQALITGRDVAVQSSKSKLRMENQVLNLLPYYLPQHELRKYDDPHNLLVIDQRSVWWAKYGEVKGKDYSTVPSTITSKNLTPITSEPLLNYLVALSYERGKIDFDNDITLNEIYADLLQAVHERKWDRGNHVGTLDLKPIHFERVLEEIALAIWHGHGRTATISSIKVACENAHLSHQLDLFKSGVKKGVTRLLTAFYFRECDSNSAAEDSFEFTHKSFGEYLISRRIAREFKKIHENLHRHYEDIDFPYDEKRAIENWLKVCGPSHLDDYIYKFLIHEVPSDESEKVEWGRTAAKLLPYAIKAKWPVDSVFDNESSEVKYKYKRNADRALMILHSVALKNTSYQTLLKGQDDEKTDIWVSGVLPKATSLDAFGSSAMLISNLNLEEVSFLGAQFSLLSTANTKFKNCNLNFIHSFHSNFIKCEFEECISNRGALFSSRFVQCKIKKCNFLEWSFIGGGFTRVHSDDLLMRASLMKNFTFFDCDLPNLSMVDTTLSHCRFEDCNLARASFSGALLYKVAFLNSDLSGVDFTEEASTSSNHSISAAVMQDVTFENVIIDCHTKFSDDQLAKLPVDLRKEYLSYRIKQ